MRAAGAEARDAAYARSLQREQRPRAPPTPPKPRRRRRGVAPPAPPAPPSWTRDATPCADALADRLDRLRAAPSAPPLIHELTADDDGRRFEIAPDPRHEPRPPGAQGDKAAARRPPRGGGGHGRGVRRLPGPRGDRQRGERAGARRRRGRRRRLAGRRPGAAAGPGGAAPGRARTPNQRRRLRRGDGTERYGQLRVEYVARRRLPARRRLARRRSVAYKCLRGGLRVAREKRVRHVAFSLLSAGVYRGSVPLERVVSVGLRAIASQRRPGLDEVYVSRLLARGEGRRVRRPRRARER